MSNLPQTNPNNNSLNKINAATNIMGIRSAALNPIQYTARVTRKNPCAIIIMIDQSGSMGEEFYNGKSKAEAVSDIINTFLSEVIDKCIRENETRDYFHLMVVGYGNELENGSSVNVAWEGNLEDKEWVTASELKQNVLRTDTIQTLKKLPFGDIPSTESKKVWINPVSDALTPMKEAFIFCQEKLEEWIRDFDAGFPPMIFNITDGYPTDIEDLSEIIEITDQIKELHTKDGNVLIFNSLINTNKVGVEPIYLPFNKGILAKNEYHSALFDASSDLPRAMSKKASEFFKNEEYLNNVSKGVIINADANCLIQLLNIGTNTAIENTE